MRYLLFIAALSALLPTHTIYVEKPVEVELDPVKQALFDKEVPLPLIRVAFCESSLKHWDSEGNVVINENSNGSVDRGLFQVNSIHQETLDNMNLDPSNLYDNIDFALYLYNKNQLRDWSASSHCQNNATT